MNNSQQIGNIKTFNSLMGGLATNTTSLLMGGNANLNLLSFKGVGMLEFSFGKDGIKSKIGMGGTNISIQNLVGAFGGATNLHKNSQINKTGYDKTVLDALRSQWGFGNDVAKNRTKLLTSKVVEKMRLPPQCLHHFAFTQSPPLLCHLPKTKQEPMRKRKIE